VAGGRGPGGSGGGGPGGRGFRGGGGLRGGRGFPPHGVSRPTRRSRHGAGRITATRLSTSLHRQGIGRFAR
ncbi:mu-protocadherin- cell-suface protein, partial [Pseudomonas aeruginosa]